MGTELWSTFPEMTNPDKLEHSSTECSFATESSQRACHNLCPGQTVPNMYVLWHIDDRRTTEAAVRVDDAVDALGNNNTLFPQAGVKIAD